MVNDISRNGRRMNGHLEGTPRAVLRRRALLLAPALVLGLGLMADVSARHSGDGYSLDVTLPGWPLVALAAVLGGMTLLWRRSRRVLLAAGTAPTAGATVGSKVPGGEGGGAAEASAGGAAEARTGAAETDTGDGVSTASNGTADLPVGAGPVERIAVRSPRVTTLVAVDDISHVEAAGRYARIHANGRQHLAQHSLGELERMLDGLRFVRVHRSAMVNLQRIRSLRTADYRDFELILDDGATVRLSRNYRARLEAALGLRI